MTDKEFLLWIAARLEKYGEPPTVDFLLRLRSLADQCEVGPTDRKEFEILERLMTAMDECPTGAHRRILKYLANRYWGHST